MKFLLFVGVFFSSWTVFGHQPNTANFSVRKISESWVLTAEFSKDKAIASLEKELSDAVEIGALSETEFKQEIIRYLKRHVALTVNDSVALLLGAGGIKMDGHHVEVILQLENLPNAIESFEVFADAFSEGPNHHNFFVWMDTKFILSHQNNFRLHSERDKDQMKKRNPVEIEPTKSH